MVAAPRRGDDDGSFYHTLVMTDSAGHADAFAPLDLGDSAQALAPKSNTGRPARTAVWKPKYYMNRPRIFLLRQIEVQRKVQLEGGG